MGKLVVGGRAYPYLQSRALPPMQSPTRLETEITTAYATFQGLPVHNLHASWQPHYALDLFVEQ